MAKNEMPMQMHELMPQPTIEKAVAAAKAHVNAVNAAAGHSQGASSRPGQTMVGGKPKGNSGK